MEATYFELTVRLSLALILGGAIGIEREYRVHAEDVALDLVVDEGMLYVFTQMLLIARLECVAHGGSQALQDLECLFLFFGCEFKRCFVHCPSLLLMPLVVRVAKPEALSSKPFSWMACVLSSKV